jgi:hypothetical protein
MEPVPRNRDERRHPATMTTPELAEAVGVSTWTVYEELRRTGHGPTCGDTTLTPLRVGRRILWSRAAVDKLLAGGVAPALAEA